jgi:hypothetical protein
MATQAAEKPQTYVYYPLSSVLNYNGVTVAHFLLAGYGLVLGFGGGVVGSVIALVYVLFAFTQMYVVMPLQVCPNCPYFRLKDSRCISALNLLARRIAKPGNPRDFPKRAEGLLCHNNLYMTALILPIPLLIVGLILNFSATLLVIAAAVVGLLLYRFFVLIPKIACPHCVAKYKCPNAKMMGIND